MSEENKLLKAQIKELYEKYLTMSNDITKLYEKINRLEKFQTDKFDNMEV